MRTTLPSLYFVVLATLMSCTTQPSSELYRLEMPDMLVSEYTTQLKKDTYTFDVLPEFSPADIDMLLDFSTDDTELTNYPVNPLSSYKGDKVKLGYLALWTVENIRLNYPYDSSDESRFLFPSKNPVLRTTSGGYEPVDDLENLIRASELYKNWWMEFSEDNFEQLRSIDPLEGSGLAWF